MSRPFLMSFSQVQKNAQHFVSRKPNPADDPRARKIELMWRLFNAWPSHTPRLEKTKAATLRMDTRDTMSVALPLRSDFQSTADYYNAVMPLTLARNRFILLLKPSSFLLGVHGALGRMALGPLSKNDPQSNR